MHHPRRVALISAASLLAGILGATPVSAVDRSGKLTIPVCGMPTDSATVTATYNGPAGTQANVYVNKGRVSVDAPLGAVIGTLNAGETRTFWFYRSTNGDSRLKTVRAKSAGVNLAYRQFDFAVCK